MLKLCLDCDDLSLNANLECFPIVVGAIVLDSKQLEVLGEFIIQDPCWWSGQGGLGGFIKMFSYKIFHKLRITEICGLISKFQIDNPSNCPKAKNYH